MLSAQCAASSPSPAAPALSPLIVGLAAAAPGRKATVVPAIAARDAHVWGLAHREAALWLVVQRHDKLRTLVRLTVQRLIRDDDGGARQCSRRDAIEHILRDTDAIERALGVVPAVDRDRRPAQALSSTRHRCEHM